jgi:3-deoxy-manno-octulosonate cytidylyltransferase (CMP-KDO synthetase)
MIPARLESSRLPRKLLLRETGKSLIQHTYEAGSESKLAGFVAVTTGDSEIRRVVEDFGGQVIETATNHPNGTRRVAEAAEKLPKHLDLIVNLQGDEPLITGNDLDDLLAMMEEKPHFRVGTLATRLFKEELKYSQSLVKVVVSNDRALYFSRAPLAGAMKHVGVYAYRRDFLEELRYLQPSPLAKAENLEQLTFLELGYEIAVAQLEHETIGVDTPFDYSEFVEYYARS